MTGFIERFFAAADAAELDRRREAAELITQAFQEMADMERRFVTPLVVEVSPAAWDIICKLPLEDAPRRPTEGSTLWGLPIALVPEVDWVWLHVRGFWPLWRRYE